MPRTRILLLTLVLSVGLLGFQAAPADHGLPHFEGGPTHFATMSDGTSIALAVYGKGACALEGEEPGDPIPAFVNKCPAILEMAGYENGSASASGRTTLGQLDDWGRENGYTGPPPPLTDDSHSCAATACRYEGSYVLVHASVRGTGCSAGEFDLFSYRSALDGYEIIESWIPKQEWFNDAANPGVAIIGHSYSGITGFTVAAIEGKALREGKPSRLKAVAISGLIDDLYRGITYPGGILNGLFPPLWTLGVRVAYDVVGGSLQGIFRNAYAGKPEIAAQCVANLSTRRRTVLNDPLVQGINDTDNDWWRARSLVEKAPLIAHPIHMSGAFQDEQTGPRFPHLWEVVPPTYPCGHGNGVGDCRVPKRLQMSNGDHGTQVADNFWQDRKAWLDYHVRGIAPDPSLFDPTDHTTVRTYLERRHQNGIGTFSGILDATSFPQEDTTWTDWYFGAGGALEEAAPQPAGSDEYVSGTKRQSWSYQAGENVGEPITTANGPDQLRFETAPFEGTRVLNGPIVANLNVSSTATDFDIFVQLADKAPDGKLSILQRGMLRASHRSLSPQLSDWADGRLYRPFHPHTNPEAVIPGEVNAYTVEVFPVAWVFRPRHTLVVKIMAAPLVDSYYSYTPARAFPLALNTVHFGGAAGSRLQLPFVPEPDGLPATGPVCGSLDSVRCVSE